MNRLIISFFIAVTSIWAANAKQIVAIEYATGTIAQTYGTASTADDQTLTQYGFKLGAKENDYRLFISYRYQEMQSSDTGYHLGMELDAFYQMGFFGIYLGAVGGYSWYDFTAEDTAKRTVEGAYYGADAGMTLTFGPLEVDAGARYAYYNDLQIDSVATQVYTINNMLTYYVGLNYLY